MAEQPEKRLYINGSRWWLRMKTPQAGEYARRSTGIAMDNVKLANRVARMIESLVDERAHRDLVAAAVDGKLALLDLYDAYSAGNMDRLRLDVERAAFADPDIESLVDTWDKTALAHRDVTDDSRVNYVRQVRALVPAGQPFLASRLTEDTIKARLAALDVSDSTRRRYMAAWALFTRFVRRQIPGLPDPFEFMDEWAPKNAGPRDKHYTHKQTRAVLDRMTGDARRAMALAFGSGMELCALLALRQEDILGERMVVAHGTKNEHRENRTIFIDAWAYEILLDGLALDSPKSKAFGKLTENTLRNEFYDAQVMAGLTPAPELSPNGKKLWRAVNPHTIHDARHTYAITRLLGLDGEPRRTQKWISMQLGHASEQMLNQVYTKVNANNRLAIMQAEIEQNDNQGVAATG